MYKEIITNSKTEKNALKLSLQNECLKTLCFCEYEVLDKDGINNFLNNLIVLEVQAIREYDLMEEESLKITSEDILNEFEENFLSINYLKEKISNELLLIHYIENSSNEKGLGTGIVNNFKERYSSIILFSDIEAISYWKKNGFKEIHQDYYLWQK